MRFILQRLPLAALVALAVCLPQAVRGAAPPTADPGGQVTRFLNSNPNTFIARAPRPPVDPKGMTLQVIDYIDCTKADDGHPMLDDGRSRVVTGDAGACRETAAAPNSWFAYRFRVAGPGRPHVVVLEFPDDGDRMTAVALAQPPSGDDEKPAAQVEFGYRTGDLLPVTGRMLARWTLFYPTSDAPAALLVADWHARRPAALARVWICVPAGDRLPPLDEPLPGHRRGGLGLGDPRNLERRFGGRVNNLLGVMDYLGLEDVVFEAADGNRANYDSKAFQSQSPWTATIMDALDREGRGAIAAFNPDGAGGEFRLPGLDRSPAMLDDRQVRNAWQAFIETDFLQPYATRVSFRGLMLGGLDETTALGRRATGGGYTSLITQMQQPFQRMLPLANVYQVLGRPTRDTHFFSEPGSDWAMMVRWQRSAKSMDELFAAHAAATWQDCGVDCEELGNQRRVVPMWRCGRDDAAAARFGRGAVPRYWLLDDAARSSQLAAAAEGLYLSGLLLDGTPDRRLIGLTAPQFWWTWSELSPTIVPAGQAYWAPLAVALGEGVTPWSVWTAADGSTAMHEADTRQVMNELLRMPLRRLEQQPDALGYPVSVRTYNTGRRFYVQLANRCAVEATVAAEWRMSGGDTEMTGTVYTLPPWGIEAFSFPGTGKLQSLSQEAPGLEPMLKARLDRYDADLDAARKAGVRLEERYDTVLREARRLFEKQRWASLDHLLSAAIVREPALRLRVAAERPRLEVGCGRITVDGRLDDWPDEPGLRLQELRHLVCHPDVANQWRGPADLSAELRLAWSEAGLHYALTVVDDRPTQDENESAALVFAADAFRSYAGREPLDYVVTLSRGRNDAAADEPNRVTRRQGNVTVHEGLLTADVLGERLRPQEGRAIGLNLIVSDSDDRAGLTQPWQKSSAMAWSNGQDGYDVWSDAQTCGEITFK
ncbi:MAG: hypothetical protein JXL80_11920 [Planctomycetes bacterium]|nr:hypothetical protein [Planctomycetota bacterium]